MDRIKALPLDYVAGLFDGEGTFAINFQKKKDTYLGFVAAPIVQIVVGHAMPVLRALQQQFGGYICLRVKVPYWRLYRRDDCRKFAEIILPYLRIKKDSCLTFIKILQKMDEGIHYTREGLLWVAREAEKLTLNTHRRKWTYQKIVEELSKNRNPRLKKPRSGRAVCWTPEEDDFLRKNFEKMSDEMLARKLNRSATAVKVRRRRLGLLRC